MKPERSPPSARLRAVSLLLGNPRENERNYERDIRAASGEAARGFTSRSHAHVVLRSSFRFSLRIWAATKLFGTCPRIG